MGKVGNVRNLVNEGKVSIVGIMTFWAEHAKRPKNANWTKQAL